jgi:hypothetical protein
MPKHIPTSPMSPYTHSLLYGDKGDIHIGDTRARGGTVPNVPLSNQQIVSNTDQSPVITLARSLRSRFGQGVRLTFYVEPERTQGRQPYWWNEVAR